MIDIDYKKIGKRIKEKRLKIKLTQHNIADKLDACDSYISQIERGESICSLATLVNIANILDLNLDNLIYGINESNADTTFSELLKTIPKDKHELYINICKDIANRLK